MYSGDSESDSDDAMDQTPFQRELSHQEMLNVKFYDCKESPLVRTKFFGIECSRLSSYLSIKLN